MALTERLALLITLDADKAVKGLESVGRSADRNLSRTESKLDKAGQKFQKVGAGMLAGAGLAAAGLYKAGQAAADLEQSVGGTEAVFKEASGTIDGFAKGAARNMGLSERAFREATTRIGGQLKGVGFDIDTAAEKSIELTGVAADLAATFGGTTAEAVDALSAAMRGEADPAERFNLRLNQTAVNAKAVELGLAESTSAVDQNAKAQAILALITEQSADAQGQFAREAGTAAGQMQIANAEFENAKASLGQAIAPIIAEVAGGLADLSGGFLKANQASGGLLSKLAAFGTIGLGTAGALAFVVGKAIEMRNVFRDVDGPFRDATGGLSRFGKAATGLGIAGTVAGLVQMARAANEVKVDLDGLRVAVNNVHTAGRDQLEGILLVAESFGDLDSVIQQVADSDVLLAEQMILAAEAAGISGEKIDELREITAGKREADVEAIKGQAKYTEEITKAAGPTSSLEEKLAALTERTKEQEEALEGLVDATLSAFDANLGYRNSVDDVQDRLAELVELQKEGKSKTEEYGDALRDAEGAMLDQAGALVRMYEETAKANGQTLTAQQRAALFKQELEKLAGALSPNSPLRAQLQAYINQLNTIPASRITDIIARFSTSNISARAQDSRFGGARASGGPVSAGQTYLVGEQGPELLHMGSSGGFVSPNSSLTSGGTIIIPVSIGGREVDRLIVDTNTRTVRRGYAA